MKPLSEVQITYSLTYQEVIEVLRIIDEVPQGLEVTLELGELKLSVKKDRESETPTVHGDPTNGPTPAAARAPVPVPTAPSPPVPTALASPGTPAAPPAPVALPAGAVEVKAPMAGTFYRAPAPDAPPYVEVGVLVQPDTIVCIIEVMKLMNEVRAGVHGRVSTILAQNATPVGHGQTLLIVEPVT